MRPTTADIALFTKNIHNVLACLVGTYVDYTIVTGSKKLYE